jgi:hypothetical protein
MWRCEQCETLNNEETCLICGEAKPVYKPPPPVKPGIPIKPVKPYVTAAEEKKPLNGRAEFESDGYKHRTEGKKGSPVLAFFLSVFFTALVIVSIGALISVFNRGYICSPSTSINAPYDLIEVYMPDNTVVTARRYSDGSIDGISWSGNNTSWFDRLTDTTFTHTYSNESETAIESKYDLESFNSGYLVQRTYYYTDGSRREYEYYSDGSRYETGYNINGDWVAEARVDMYGTAYEWWWYDPQTPSHNDRGIDIYNHPGGHDWQHTVWFADGPTDFHFIPQDSGWCNFGIDGYVQGGIPALWLYDSYGRLLAYSNEGDNSRLFAYISADTAYVLRAGFRGGGTGQYNVYILYDGYN